MVAAMSGALPSAMLKEQGSLEHRMDARFEAVDRRFDTVERRIDVLDGKVSRQFVWLAGLQVTTLVATAGALVAILGALLTRA